MIALLLVAAGFFVFKGQWEALSAVYGGLISVLVAFLLGRGVARAAGAAPQDHKRSLVMLYLGAAQRFVLVGVLFAAGLAAFKLLPLAMIAGFGAAQLIFIVAMRGGGRN